MSRKKIIVMNLALIALLIGAFDLVTYLFVPGRYLEAFEGYRKRPDSSLTVSDGWPHDYYVANEERGFDIGFDRAESHRVDDVTYPIWSNSLGCFDTEHASFENYVYFAGDSFTWGYAPFQAKFGSLIEQQTGTPILKCGVEHTGQRHQYSKFTEIMKRTGHAPKAVFVFYFENDIANDYAYPHSTAIDGWLIDNVSLDSRNELVHTSREQLTRRVAGEVAQNARRAREAAWPLARFKTSVKRYSMTANILLAAKSAMRKNESSKEAGPSGNKGNVNFYTVPYRRGGKIWYLDNPYARRNQEGLLEFKAWAGRNRVPLVVVLIPRGQTPLKPQWYAEVHQFLRQNGIRFLDLTSSFEQRGVDPADVSWERNAHFSVAGNALVADIVMGEFPEIFSRASAGELRTSR